MKRRSLLVGGLGAGGALIVGWALLPARSRIGGAASMPRVAGEVGLNGWIRIAGDGGVRLAMHRSEMGQGVHTALAMLVAEELDLPLDRVQLVPAGPDTLYGNVSSLVAGVPVHPADTEPEREPAWIKGSMWVVSKLVREFGINVTGGSSSIVDSWEVLRLAAATARAQLLGAASLRWKLPAGELSVDGGVVSHPSGMKAHYGELAAEAAATPSGDVRLKTPAQWKLIGTAAPRTDIAAKCDGSAIFGIDVRPEGLLFAAIRHCPLLGGGAGAVDVDAALRTPGVERVVRLGPYAGSAAAVAVVGRTSWHAERGADALRIEWRQRPAGALSSAAIGASLRERARDAAASGEGFVFHSRGDVAEGERKASRTVERAYAAPYLAHAAMEPVNCTARVADGRVEVWSATQVPGMARALAAEVAGVPADAVDLHVTYIGGAFGRRLETDVVGQAVRIAVECGGRPVQLMWSRAEDTTHDFYRPASAAVLRAGLGADGLPLTFSATSAGDAVTPRWLERNLPWLAGPVDLPDKTTAEGLFDQAWDIPNQRIAHVATASGVPVGYWRSVGHSHNAFFGQCFLDELAHEAGADPLAYRAALLKGAPRHLAVLRLAADRAGWPGRPNAAAATPLAPGRARGIALHESFGSIVAQVVEASIEDGRPRVHRVVCAADIGTVVNPGIVAQQIEGGVLFGLAAALSGRVDIDGGVVKQKTFDDAGALRLAQAPRIETHLVPSTRPPGGVGEIGVPPLAPALAGALFALTGRRFRELPFVL